MITTKTISLNGSEWTFCYDWDAQILAEKNLGISLIQPSGTHSEIIRVIAYARLLKHHPAVTLEDVGKLLPGNMTIIADTIHDIGDNQSDDAGPKVVENPLTTGVSPIAEAS